MRNGGFSTKVPRVVELLTGVDSVFVPPHPTTTTAATIAPKALRNLFMPCLPLDGLAQKSARPPLAFPETCKAAAPATARGTAFYALCSNVVITA